MLNANAVSGTTMCEIQLLIDEASRVMGLPEFPEYDVCYSEQYLMNHSGCVEFENGIINQDGIIELLNIMCVHLMENVNEHSLLSIPHRYNSRVVVGGNINTGYFYVNFPGTNAPMCIEIFWHTCTVLEVRAHFFV